MAAYLNVLRAFLTNPLSMESTVLNTRYYSRKEETDLFVLMYFFVALILLYEIGCMNMCNSNNEKKTNKTTYCLSMWPGLTVRILTHM